MSTSISSSRSTTSSATRPATPCSWPWPSAWRAAPARPTSSRGWAATSSPCCSSRPVPRRSRRSRERIAAAFAEPFVVGDLRLQLGVSIGRSVYPVDAGDPDGLLRSADSRHVRGQARAPRPARGARPVPGRRLTRRPGPPQGLVKRVSGGCAAGRLARRRGRSARRSCRRRHRSSSPRSTAVRVPAPPSPSHSPSAGFGGRTRCAVSGRMFTARTLVRLRLAMGD